MKAKADEEARVAADAAHLKAEVDARAALEKARAAVEKAKADAEAKVKAKIAAKLKAEEDARAVVKAAAEAKIKAEADLEKAIQKLKADSKTALETSIIAINAGLKPDFNVTIDGHKVLVEVQKNADVSVTFKNIRYVVDGKVYPILSDFNDRGFYICKALKFASSYGEKIGTVTSQDMAVLNSNGKYTNLSLWSNYVSEVTCTK